MKNRLWGKKEHYLQAPLVINLVFCHSYLRELDVAFVLVLPSSSSSFLLLVGHNAMLKYKPSGWHGFCQNTFLLSKQLGKLPSSAFKCDDVWRCSLNNKYRVKDVKCCLSSVLEIYSVSTLAGSHFMWAPLKKTFLSTFNPWKWGEQI